MAGKKKKDGYFEGQLLIATPSLYESCFSRSVIYLCNHNEEGAMGIIINHTIDDVDAGQILKQFNIKISDKNSLKFPVHFGGPVEMVRGFVLHSTDYENRDTMLINEHVSLTSNINVLRDIASGKGPEKRMLALGYTGWGPNQLEKEIERNSWFTVPASRDLIFDHKNRSKWEDAAASGGIDLLKFSTTAGHA